MTLFAYSFFSFYLSLGWCLFRSDVIYYFNIFATTAVAAALMPFYFVCFYTKAHCSANFSMILTDEYVLISLRLVCISLIRNITLNSAILHEMALCEFVIYCNFYYCLFHLSKHIFICIWFNKKVNKSHFMDSQKMNQSIHEQTFFF